MKGMFAQGRVRLAHRRDKAEPGIIYRLRLHGWAVFPLSGTPGLPDLLCVKRGQVHLLEVKGEATPAKPAQVRMHRALRLAGLTVPIVSTPEEALAVLDGGPPRTIDMLRVSRAPRRRYAKKAPPLPPADSEALLTRAAQQVAAVRAKMEENVHRDMGRTVSLKVTHPALRKGTP